MNKNTKKALLASAMSLLMCVTMLVGTTFAWFTDSVSSTNNIIKSGILDVAFEYSYDFANWNDVKEDTNMFDGSLWEPGYTKVVYLRASNIGNLDLIAKINLIIAKEVKGINVAGDSFKLSEYIYYDIEEVSEVLTRDEANTLKTTENTVQTGGSSDEIKLYNENDTAGVSEKVLALIVYMPETVGNEANYRGDKAPEITLGIELLATQLVSEEDSFGNTYDEDAEYSESTIEIIPEYSEGLNYTNLYVKNELAGRGDWTGEELIVPATYNGNPVTQITTMAFRGDEKLTKVDLSATAITYMNDYSFAECKKLKAVILPNGLESVGAYAFAKCSSLTEVTFPSTLTKISASAFRVCSSLTQIDLSNTKVSSIGGEAFIACNLETIKLPATLTSIGSMAFRDNANLKTVTFAGTMAQWSQVTLGNYWCYNTQITEIVCSDGTVTLS